MAENPKKTETRPGATAADEPEQDREASPAAPLQPSPEPEEVPELLGERSDYPISRGE